MITNTAILVGIPEFMVVIESKDDNNEEVEGFQMLSFMLKLVH